MRSASNAELCALAASLLLALLALPARADIFAAGDFHLRTCSEPGSLELTARLPALPAPPEQIDWPAGCVQTDLQRNAMGERIQLLYLAHCAQPLARGAMIRTVWRIDGGRMTFDRNGERSTIAVRGDAAGLALPLAPASPDARPWQAVFPEMVQFGARHIAFGWDHLAFVLCLCMMVTGWPLLWLVTAFTLGHSLALSAAALDILRLPQPPTEALIALSILMVARQGLLGSVPGTRRAAAWRRAGVVIVFGLVHGLGFAGALRETGVREGELLPALVGFNLGVELGQLLFVGLILTTLSMLRPIGIDAPARRAALYAAGIAGTFWLAERVVAFA